jgi:Phenazine biosynthesis-like protein
VFTDPAGFDTDTMARMTREMNVSECTFVFPCERTDTDVRLRIFGLGGEMPFAGHPVIGSTFALAYEHLIKPGQPRLVFGLIERMFPFLDLMVLAAEKPKSRNSLHRDQWRPLGPLQRVRDRISTRRVLERRA